MVYSDSFLTILTKRNNMHNFSINFSIQNKTIYNKNPTIMWDFTII